MTPKEQDNIIGQLYDVMKNDFMLADIRIFCNMTDYSTEKVIAAYEYMKDYKQEIPSPVGFMIKAIQNGWKKKKPKKNSFNSFEQNEYDFEKLEEMFLEN